MAEFYIEPKYNSGEKVAGGTLTIYTDNTYQELVQLYSVADQKPQFAIPNPVAIDNNGINSSPIFFTDYTEKSTAYYVLRDAKNAIIRHGFVTPYSWNIASGEVPNPPNPWDSTLKGDPFWGYEIVDLNFSKTDIGRPLYLRTSSAGDRSGGLIVYETDGTGNGDNILTFSSAGANKIWKAREEYINFSYLASIVPNPFSFIEANYKGQYNINLDSLPTSNANIGNSYFSGKVKIEKTLSGNSTAAPSYIFLKSENLEIVTANAMVLNGDTALSAPIVFAVNGGSWNHNSICDQNGNCFLRGRVDNINLSGTSIALDDLTVDLLNGSLINPQLNRIFAKNNARVIEIENTAIENIAASKLNELGVDKIRTSVPDKAITVDADINFYAEGAYSVNLTGNINYVFHIKPCRLFRYDNTFYAKNAEFYSVATPGDNVSDYSHVIGDICSGTAEINQTNSNKLIFDSNNVDLVGEVGYNAVVNKARNISGCTIFLNNNSLCTEINSCEKSTVVINAENSEPVKINRSNFRNCKFFQNSNAEVYLYNSEIEKSDITLGAIYITSKCKLNKNNIKGNIFIGCYDNKYAKNNKYFLTGFEINENYSDGSFNLNISLSNKTANSFNEIIASNCWIKGNTDFNFYIADTGLNIKNIHGNISCDNNEMVGGTMPNSNILYGLVPGKIDSDDTYISVVNEDIPINPINFSEKVIIIKEVLNPDTTSNLSKITIGITRTTNDSGDSYNFPEKVTTYIKFNDTYTGNRYSSFSGIPKFTVAEANKNASSLSDYDIMAIVNENAISDNFNYIINTLLFYSSIIVWIDNNPAWQTEVASWNYTVPQGLIRNAILSGYYFGDHINFIDANGRVFIGMPDGRKWQATDEYRKWKIMTNESGAYGAYGINYPLWKIENN